MIGTGRVAVRAGTAPSGRRFAAAHGNTTLSLGTETHVPRWPLRKIAVGKSRPKILHQFELLVQMSDGSVVKRRTQLPRDEIRMVNDQRNSLLWNPSRSDLVQVDLGAKGRLDKFNAKYRAFHGGEEAVGGAAGEAAETAEAAGEAGEEEADPYLDLMGVGFTPIKGGNVAFKKGNRRSGKK